MPVSTSALFRCHDPETVFEMGPDEFLYRWNEIFSRDKKKSSWPLHRCNVFIILFVLTLRNGTLNITDYITFNYSTQGSILSKTRLKLQAVCPWTFDYKRVVFSKPDCGVVNFLPRGNLDKLSNKNCFLGTLLVLRRARNTLL